MHAILKLDLFNETLPGASAWSREYAHKKYNSNQSSRSKNIEVLAHPRRAFSRYSSSSSVMDAASCAHNL